MNKPWVYIAGPITVGDTHRHVYNAMGVFKHLHDAGLHPICPHWSALQQMSFPIDYDDWLRYDFDTIAYCDAVLRISGESAGADRETDFATSIRIPVFYDVDRLLEHYGAIS